MCFVPKVKTPAVNTSVPAPEPVLLDAPKGVEYGDGSSSNTNTDPLTKINKSSPSDQPAGSTTTSGIKTPKFSYTTSAVRKGIEKKGAGK